jgi:uncharacterized protein (DUF2267 family)
VALLPASIMNLPRPIRFGLALLAVIAVGVGVALAPRPVNWLILALVIAGALVLALYGVALRVLDRRRIGPFQASLGENVGTAPKQVRDPAARARIDELRSKFEEGASVFREHGKDLYSIPWYLIVGEPGSGKTEAVRHSGVGFPPGLQDELQGSGGTLNMNWWFTNHAVILDTAGRLLFEEVEAGSTSEWREFLKLLRSARPNCPVNGMLLVIPADSLIRDTGEQIEAKASQIAEQLDHIQRALGVRFPVFVVITKADLINGFREFFDDMTDPAEQHQMLGWSNPAPLDSSFSPDAVEEHLKTVRERLLRRRLRLLGGVGSGVEPGLERADALYAFPDSLMKLAPRLRRYLEMVFVQGEWSARPLFLRGIYFTSSMREGSALDQDLAEVLGVDVGSLPEGRAWERDRSYFLKDLFLSKVFKERGLVTRAASASKTKRRRQAAVLGAGFVMVAGIALLTWLGDRQLREAIIAPSEFWSRLNQAMRNERGEVDAGVEDIELVYYDQMTARHQYQGENPVNLGAIGMLSTVDMLKEAQKRSTEAPEPPAIFAPVAQIWGDPFEEAPRVQRVLFEKSVLDPLVTHTRSRLTRPDEAWSEAATAALGELIEIELAAQEGATGSPSLDLDRLLGYVLQGNDAVDPERRRRDAQTLQKVLEVSYPEGQGWPPEDIRGPEGVSARIIREGVDRFVAFWAERGGADSPTLVELRTLGDAADRFEQAERAILALGDRALIDDAWDEAYAELVEARDAIDEALASAGVSRQTDPVELQARVREESLEAARSSFQTLLRRLAIDEDQSEESEFRAELRERLEGSWDGLQRSIDRRLSDTLERVDRHEASLLARTNSVDQRFSLRFAVFEAMHRARETRPGREGIVGLGGALETIAQAHQRGEEELTTLGSASVGAPRRTLSFGREALEALRRGRTGQVIRSALADLQGDAGSIEGFVERRAADLGLVERPSLPLTRLDGGHFDPRYHARAAGEVFRGLEAARALLSRDDAGALVDGAEQIRRGLDEADRRLEAYARAYLGYWLGTVFEEAQVFIEPDWGDCFTKLGRVDALELNPVLAELTRNLIEALGALPESVLAGDARAMRLQRVLGDELAELSDGRFSLECGRAIDRWRLLSPDVEDARASVLILTPGAFKREYMLLHDRDEMGPGRGYWSQVQYQSLVALAQSASDRASDARDRLIREGRGFPLCLDCAETLDPGAVRQSVALMGLIDLPGDLETGARNRIGSGDFGSLDTPVQEQLKRLRGDLIWASAEQRRWYERLSEVLALFDESAGAFEQELVILRRASQEDPSIVGEFPVMEIYLGGRRLPINGEGMVPSDRLNTRTGLRLPTPIEEGIEVRFRRSAGGPVEAVGRAPAPWGGLGAVRWSTGPMDPDDVSPEGLPVTGVWRLPLELTTMEGRPLRQAGGGPRRYVLGVRFFGRQIPDPTTWATERTWPID